MYHYAGNNPVKYTAPDGNWFGFDDVFTGPIDELLVLGGLTLIGAWKIYKNNEDTDFSSSFSESFHNNIEKIKELFSKKKNKSSDDKKDSPSPDDDSKNGYKPAPDDLPGVPDAKPSKPKTPKQGDKSGKRKRWKDSDGNIYEWDYQHGDVEKYDKRGNHKGSIDPKTGEQTKPPIKGRRIEP